MKAMKILRYATMLVFVLASIRIITGASDLTSTGTASAALLLSVPIVWQRWVVCSQNVLVL